MTTPKSVFFTKNTKTYPSSFGHLSKLTLASADERRILLWEVESGKQITQLSGHSDTVRG